MNASNTYLMGKRILVALAAILLLAPAYAGAYTPVLVDWEIAQALREGFVNLALGSGFDTSLMIRLKNRDPNNGALIQFPGCVQDREPAGVFLQINRNSARDTADGTPRRFTPAWQACFPGLYDSNNLVFLRPGADALIEMAVDFRQLGKIQVLAQARVFVVDAEDLAAGAPQKPHELAEFLQRGQNAGRMSIDLYYEVAQNQNPSVSGGLPSYRLSNYAELFVPSLPTPEAGVGSGDVGEILSTTPVVIDEYMNCRPRPLEDEEVDLEHNLALIGRIPHVSGLGEQIPCQDPAPNPCTPGREISAKVQLRGAAVDPTFTLQGSFSVKWTDHALHPAFGWRVRAWWNSPGGWRQMAEDWIQWNGAWQLIFSYPGYTGQNLRVQYVAFNRYFTPQTNSGDTYRWKGPDRTNVPQNWNEGAWLADCDGGAARGLGEVYNEGLTMWSKLYWTGGIDPLRSASMKLIFPNTTYDCGDGTGVAWSCANREGTVWLIPSHALRNGTVQHEFGHQLNFQYWGNKLPASAAGSHNLNSCYTNGLALVEGFGDFMPFWVQVDRGTAPNAANFDFNVETPGATCQARTNESWVGATFWDLYDSHGDGQDILWFNHPGAVISLFLSNGVARDGDAKSISDYRTIYRNAASAGHQTIIDNIFTQNHTN